MGRYIYSGITAISAGAKRIFYKPVPGGVSPYTATWTVPTGVSCATFEVWGGGGAGSPTCCCTCYNGNSGSGGGYTIKTIAVNPGDSYALTVGQGGCGNECWYNGNACGCRGQTSYVTGTGLTNLCATGGCGGYWCNAGTFSQAPGSGYGGDYNFTGKSNQLSQCSYAWYSCRGLSIGGAAPFGGGWQIQSGSGYSCLWPGMCASTGIFPGGGGIAKPTYLPGWCDCCAGCTGGGADGLVIITI